MEGRDIGSNVFPETNFKFYLDASLQARSERRAAEGVNENLAARDQRDSERAAAPLMIPLGAMVINNSKMTSEQTSAIILEEIRKRLKPEEETAALKTRSDDARHESKLLCRLALFSDALFTVYFRWRVFNPERVPGKGPVILAANHASYIDPPMVGSGLKRAINYLARESLFHIPVLATILRSWKVVPVDRDGGTWPRLRAQSHFGSARERWRHYFVSRRNAHAGRQFAGGALWCRSGSNKVRRSRGAGACLRHLPGVWPANALATSAAGCCQVWKSNVVRGVAGGSQNLSEAAREGNLPAGGGRTND